MGSMKLTIRKVFAVILMVALCPVLAFAAPLHVSATGIESAGVTDLPFLDEPRPDTALAFINKNGAFLSVDDDLDTLRLSVLPCFWRMAPSGDGFHILWEDEPSLMFDLDNAWYEIGTRVHLFVDTGYACQNWLLSEYEDGFIILSAEDPSWCVLSGDKGFSLGKPGLVTQNDIWYVVEAGDWSDGFVSGAEEPLYRAEYKAQSFTPSPQFWASFDKNGITDKMKKESKHIKDYYAQYVCVDPVINDTGGCFDFFSVEFRTSSQPKYTYWSLLNWWMDTGEYMRRKGYTDVATVGAYAGLQKTDNKTTGIMSMWEMVFSGSGKKNYTLTPTCVYPKGKSTHFDNEGSGASLVIPFEWKAKTWYRFVVRSWNNKKTDSTYVGSWVEDLSTGEIRLLAVYDTHLPDSFMTGNMGQFLENFGESSYGSYRKMQLRNYCLHDPQTDAWYFPDKVVMSIWTDLGFNQGTYRFQAAKGVFTAETCGLGKNVCEGKSMEETEVLLSAKPATSAPDPKSYKAKIK